MASHLTWLLLAAVAICSAEPNRIVGGDPTTIEEYPAIVQVDFRNGILWGQNCAANILTTRYVVSAAHCFSGLLFSPSLRRIRAGSTNRNQGGVVIGVSRVFNHHSYNSRTLDGDISVILLSKPLEYSATIQQTAIISRGTVLPDNIPVVHAGWGAVRQGGLASSVLRDVTIYTINNRLCAERYLTLPRPGGVVTENMICAGILDVGGRDACQGDSGGPLYYDDILIGIVSWGHGCANETFPGVSAAVSSYTDWIVATAV